MIEFNMTVQEACEAPGFITNQMFSSFGEHEKLFGSLILNEQIPKWIRKDLSNMGYKLSYREKTSGPVNAIYFDREHGSFWGGSSNFGEDYGIGW
jgi:gamma-glutamyltranspeptidase/glutathione hydrolase